MRDPAGGIYNLEKEGGFKGKGKRLSWGWPKKGTGGEDKQPRRVQPEMKDPIWMAAEGIILWEGMFQALF